MTTTRAAEEATEEDATGPTCPACTFPEFLVTYPAKVYAEVVEGEVVRVVVDDENLGPGAVSCRACGADASPELAAEVLAAVDATTWPGWNFGW